MTKKILAFVLMVVAGTAVWWSLRPASTPSPTGEAPAFQPVSMASAPSSPTPNVPETVVTAISADNSAAAPGSQAEAQPSTPPEEPPVLQYVLEDVTGNVQVLPTGGGTAQPGTEGQALRIGDSVATDPGASAVLALNEQTNVRVNPGTEVTLAKLEGDPDGKFASLLKLIKGDILSQVQDLKLTHSTYEVDSGGVVCGVRGTVFEVVARGGDVSTVTQQGTVAVRTADAREELVGAGRVAQFRRGRFFLRRAINAQERQRFENWRARRGRVLQKRRSRIERRRQARQESWRRGRNGGVQAPYRNIGSGRESAGENRIPNRAENPNRPGAPGNRAQEWKRQREERRNARNKNLGSDQQTQRENRGAASQAEPEQGARKARPSLLQRLQQMKKKGKPVGPAVKATPTPGPKSKGRGPGPQKRPWNKREGE